MGTGDGKERRGFEEAEGDGGREWEVATGVLNNVVDHVRVERHENVEDTEDGGLAIWITEQNGWPLPGLSSRGHEQSVAEPGEHGRDIIAAQPPHAETHSQSPPSTDTDVLHAHCLCKTVKFHITRPNGSSLLPRSQFPDLMIPYHTQDPVIPNPGDEKWWLRAPGGTSVGGSGDLAGARYLAGTCACRSCRLTSGFEIQVWAFVPRCNIYFHVARTPDSSLEHYSNEPEEVIIPLDFDELRKLEKAGKTGLKGYEFSPGVMREFCGVCGATVFWHDKWRPEVVDVSVGLLKAQEGARAEEWLEWWMGRVSFEEDAEGRGDLIPALKRGLGSVG